jgi:hypothetical protein
MADTARTLAELQVLLADNTIGAISPQDIRDMLVSLVSIHGEITLNAPATTPIASVNVWYPVSGTFWDLTASSYPPAEWDEPVDGQLRYTGSPARRVVALSTVTTTVGAGTVEVEYGIGKNGTVVDASITGSDRVRHQRLSNVDGPQHHRHHRHHHHLRELDGARIHLMIRVKVMVPHDHMSRYTVVDLIDTDDVRVRIAKGYLLPVDELEEATNGRRDYLPSER